MKTLKIALLTLVFGISSWASAANVPLLLIADSVNFGMQLRIERALSEAKQNAAPAVFIELDTPGGYLEVTRHIVQQFLVSEIPIIIYVAPQGSRAASAGAMITMAAHFAAMAPSTSIGAATPVSGQGEDIGGDLKNKVTNDTVAFVEGIAEKRGRNKAFAKLSVTEAASLTASDALKQNVVDGVYASRKEVWEAARKKYPSLPASVTFEIQEQSLKEKSMSLLSNPNVAYGLMALGMLGIYMEIGSPGLVVPGLIGVTSLALGAFSMQIIPVQTGAVILLVLGLIFLAIEVFTPLPTFGMAGVGALFMFYLSGLFLMDETQGNIHLDPGLWIPLFTVACLSVGLTSYLSFRALKGKVSTTQGSQGMVGLEARITRFHADSASLAVIGEIWTGIPSEGRLDEYAVDELVKIVSQEGLKVFFTKKTEGVI